MIEKWKVIALVICATLAVASGEAILAKGMKLSSNADGSGMLATVKAVLNRHVIVGTILMTLYFGMYMLALKWADLSFVLPLTALSFLFGAVLARYYLHETITPTRWIGTLIIMAGVVVVGLGESSKP